MSDAFTDREKGFERKYQLDQEQKFRALARRDRLFGQWAAGKLGHTGAAADGYAKAVVDANFDRPGDEDMLDKVRKDFAAKSVAISDKELHAKLEECHQQAAGQVATESKSG